VLSFSSSSFTHIDVGAFLFFRIKRFLSIHSLWLGTHIRNMYFSKGNSFFFAGNSIQNSTYGYFKSKKNLYLYLYLYLIIKELTFPWFGPLVSAKIFVQHFLGRIYPLTEFHNTNIATVCTDSLLLFLPTLPNFFSTTGRQPSISGERRHQSPPWPPLASSGTPRTASLCSKFPSRPTGSQLRDLIGIKELLLSGVQTPVGSG
jgi:hypothetical protein